MSHPTLPQPPTTEVPPWLVWARELQAMSQIGLTYSANTYDRERYARLAEISAAIVASCTSQSFEPMLSDFRFQPGYATPKVDVRAAVVKNGAILLVREHDDGRWAMPGGWVDVGDLPSEAVVREVREETGLRVAASKLIGLFDGNRVGEPLSFYHAYKLVFLCEVLDGEAQRTAETLDVAYFDFDDLPPLSSERTAHRHLAEVLAHVHAPGRLAAFD